MIMLNMINLYTDIFTSTLTSMFVCAQFLLRLNNTLVYWICPI